jgi:tRNA1Val (adenine37-N6)-methyltransferase
VPAKVVANDPVLGDLSDDRLTRDFRVFQRAKGHRFSVDDVATAYVAAHASAKPARILDLGTGLGSVLLHLAWFFPEARLVGIEAQDASYDLLCRNVQRNSLNERVRTIHGDLRDAPTQSEAGTLFDLVTGTPPYFPDGAAIDADDRQRAMARVEYRGGVEAYLEAARACVAPEGTVVLCGDALSDARVRAAQAELRVVHRTDVIAKAGKKALFSVWALRMQSGTLADETRGVLTLRTESGELTDDARRLRAFSGFDTPAGMR